MRNKILVIFLFFVSLHIEAQVRIGNFNVAQYSHSKVSKSQV